MRKFIFLAALAGCVAVNDLETTASPSPVSDIDQQAVSSAMSNLKDPNSAQFRALRAYTTKEGGRIVCGQYNARNSFGGYGGFQQFYLRHRGGRVVAALIGDSSDVGEIREMQAAGACRQAASGTITVQSDA